MSDLQILRVPAEHIGYGRMGLQIEASLRRLGVSVSVDIDEDPAGTVLLCSTPSHLQRFRKGQRLVLLSMWESTHLPEAFREAMHLYNLILVPSLQNVDMFSEFHDNVRFVPLGVDPSQWYPMPRPVPTSRFTFLIGGSGPRKGVDVAVKAFKKAFPDGSWGDGPEPWLTLKSPKPADVFAQRVSQVNGRISPEDEIMLYATSHCYLQPSRGEGFGMQPLQAIAQGMPTILTDAHGHASFAHLGIGIPATLQATGPGSFMFGEAGDWWEPDVDALADRMRWVYENYEQAVQTAAVNAQQAADTFTWDHTAQRILDEIGDLPPYTGDGTWQVPDIKKYRTILVRDHAADIAGHHYQWKAGEEYFEVADVKRILFEGGHLDISCVYGDSGLTDEQMKNAQVKSGRNAFCITCGSQLNTKRNLMDEFKEARGWA